MIHEIASWFRERGQDISRNEIAFNAMLGLIVMWAAAIAFILVLPLHPEVGIAGPLTLATGIGALAGLVAGGILHDMFYQRTRVHPIPFIAGVIIGLASAYGLATMLPMLLVLAIPTVILAEVIFLRFDNREPNPGEHVLWFTAKRKVAALIESFVGVLAIFGLFKGGKHLVMWAQANWAWVKQFFGVVGIVAVIMLAVYIYIRLNAMKYNRVEQEEEEQQEETETVRKTSKKKRRK